MAESKLFQPLTVGKMQLKHRLVMAPLTRFRADDNHVQLPFVKEYYSQRASVPGTLLITEATLISRKGAGYNNVPGIWTQDQIAAWKGVTDAVHAKGSYIYLQLWALGRVASPDYAKANGIDVLGASAIPEKEGATVPKEITKEDIKEFIADYTQAAKNAIEAGFDGVELHGANGYLIDQFLQFPSNQRTDEYGGSVENRSRFALEVAAAVVDAVGAERVGIRLSPWSTFQGMRMDNPIPQFTHVIEGLKKLKLAYLHVVESRVAGSSDITSTDKIGFAIDAWQKTSPVFIAGGFKPDLAKKAADEEYKDHDVAIVFGRYFLSTPDLPFRIQNGIDLNPYDRTTFYKPKAQEGYLDYPFSEQWRNHISVEARI